MYSTLPVCSRRQEAVLQASANPSSIDGAATPKGFEKHGSDLRYAVFRPLDLLASLLAELPYNLAGVILCPHPDAALSRGPTATRQENHKGEQLHQGLVYALITGIGC